MCTPCTYISCHIQVAWLLCNLLLVTNFPFVDVDRHLPACSATPSYTPNSSASQSHTSRNLHPHSNINPDFMQGNKGSDQQIPNNIFYTLRSSSTEDIYLTDFVETCVSLRRSLKVYEKKSGRSILQKNAFRNHWASYIFSNAG